MESKEVENSIKEIIKPHFGYLSMYKKWVKANSMTLQDVDDFNTYIKTHKNIIGKLPMQLNSYKSYYKAVLDISKVEKDEELKRIFKNGLNGSSRKFFNETYDEYKRSYSRLTKNEFKMRVFFRNSSKPHTINDYLIHLKRSLSFANGMADLIDDVETNYDYIRTRGDAYLFELTSNLLHIVPNSWCMYKSEEDYDREKESRNLNSIWLLIDPCETDDERQIVGIDVSDDHNDLLYMDTLNNRFTKNIPITSREFFEITKGRLRATRPTDYEITEALKDYMVLEIEKEKGPSLLDGFFNSEY
jgi:hypothetical protein